ncbi:hypothetical protein RUND412_002174 [Rhizina undulata]
MSRTLSIEEIRAHPDLPKVIEFQTPCRAGKAPVATGRASGLISISYEVHGTGPIHLVWVMGLNATKIAWHRQTRYFGHERSDQFTSLVFDNRGIGDSDAPLVKYSTLEMAKDLLDLLDHLGWSEKRQIHVIGVSMGGMIVQELAYLAPERIASLTLQSTAANLVTTVPWYQHLYHRFFMILPKPLSAQLAANQANLFSSAWLSRPDDTGLFPTNRDRYIAEELWRRKELKPTVYQGYLLQALAASWHYMGPERLNVLGEKIPDILVCTGTTDAMIDCKHSDTLIEGIGGGVKKRVFEGVGHCLQFEANMKYNAMIEEFVTAAHNRVRSQNHF